MSIERVVSCDLPTCNRRGAPRYLTVDLGALTGDNYHVPGADQVQIHLCVTCAPTREARALVAARLEKAAAKLAEFSS